MKGLYVVIFKMMGIEKERKYLQSKRIVGDFIPRESVEHQIISFTCSFLPSLQPGSESVETIGQSTIGNFDDNTINYNTSSQILCEQHNAFIL